MNNKIKYLKGDATQPVGVGTKIIVHICNNIGGWGRGFVLALSKRWLKPEEEYLKWYQSQNEFELGNVQFVQVENDLFVANLIGQHDVVFKNSIPPIRYKAVEKGLKLVAQKAKKLNASVHMPRIGAGLAGGEWTKIETIINSTLIAQGIKVVVYDFDESKK